MKNSTWPVSFKVSSIIAAMGLLLSTAGSHTHAAAVRAPAPITIGMSLSLTGDFSADGIAFQQGYTLWADDINKHGGLLGRQVKLIILSDASSPAQATTDYQKLINVDHVDLLFGPFSTLLTKPASVVANRYGYALVEGAGGGPSVFTRGLHNVFDVSLPVANSLVSFAQYLLALPPSIRPKTAAYATQDDPFTQPQVDVARALLEKGGIKTVYHTVYPAETTDYTPIADAVIHSNAQVGIFGTLLQDITAFIQAFRQQHFSPQGLIATAGPDQGAQFIKAIGLANTEGIFVPNGGWFPDANNPGNRAMVQEFLKKYGGKKADISADVPEAYAVGQVVAQAVTKNNSLDNAKLIAALHGGATFTSVQGPVRFDATGQNTMAQAYLFQWQRGNLIPVFPPAQAQAKPEYPKPGWH